MANQRNRRRNDEEDDEFDDGDEDNDSENDSEDDELAHLPPYVIPRVEKLQKLHGDRDKIMEQYLIERAALEKKFERLLTPLYDERASIVVGEKDDEIAIESENNSDETSDDIISTESTNMKGIPQFWACTMARMEAIGEIISEDDVDCLEHLVDIKCIDREDGKGFTLEFHFTPNDYFTNTVLSKEYEVPNLLLPDEPVLKNVIGTKIDWKKDRCLTLRTVKKKQRGKGRNAGQVRTVEKKEEKESFFKWFSPPEMPTMEVLDEEEADRLEEIFDGDFEIAETFRSEVIPKAILWFTNQAGEEEMQAVIEAAIADGVQ